MADDDDVVALALALAVGDPRAVVRRVEANVMDVGRDDRDAVRARAGRGDGDDDDGDGGDDDGDGDGDARARARAQASLAMILRASAKLSPAYAARCARRAIERASVVGGCVRDDVAAYAVGSSGGTWETGDAAADADADGFGFARSERDGWRNRAYLYAPVRGSARARAIENRESSALTSLGTRACDAIFARTQSDALAGSTGAFAWPAGFVACELIASKIGDELVRNRRVVELGSGTGVTATVLARASPKALTLTDRDATTLENLAANLRLNAAIDRGANNVTVAAMDVTFDALDAPASMRAGTCSVRELDWERASTSSMFALDAEFVLAADCSYDPTLIPGLVRALRALLKVPSSDASAQPTKLMTLDAAAAEARLSGACAKTPCALILSAVRQETTMDVLIDALERARLHPVDVTSVLDAKHLSKFLFRPEWAHARDEFRAFACTPVEQS